MNRIRTGALALLLPTISGVLYFLSWVGFGFWPLAFFCFVPLLYSLRQATPRQALRRGWWMGFVTHLGGYTWVVHMLKVFAFLPAPLAVLGYLLLCAAQGLLFGVVAFVLVLVQRRFRLPLVALLPVCLCAVEWAYPLLFQSYTGVSLMPLVPLVQIADLGGVLLLSALQAMVNGALADALFESGGRFSLRTLSSRSLTISAACIGAALGYGVVRLRAIDAREQAAPKLAVGLAQPNVGELALHDNPLASVQALWDETAEADSRGAKLVIWPEAGFDTHPINLDYPGFGKTIQGGVPVALIAGVIRVGRGRDFWNSAVVVSKDGLIGDHYDKIKLLAFGEYIPLGDWFPIIYRWSPMSSHLSRGSTVAPLRVGPYTFATIICYEDILPDMVREVMADQGLGRANAIVNLTNDSWYGDGHEQEQHLILASVRTIEHRRWLLRATSTGISAFVDASGRIIQRIPRDLRAVAVRDVPMLKGTTLYEILGDWPGYLSAFFLAGLFVAHRLRRQRAIPS